MNRVFLAALLSVILLFAGCIGTGSQQEAQKNDSAVPVATQNGTSQNATVAPGEVPSIPDNASSTASNDSQNAQGNTGKPSDCVDSDGGFKINQSGFVIYLGREYKDRCETGNLYEYYCNGWKLDGSVVSCPAATRCVDGACVYWTPTCTEYPDEQYVKLDGNAGGTQSFHNFCSGPDALLKYYCSGSHVLNMTVSCSASQYCSYADASCKQLTCRDHFNYVAYGNTVYSDRCYSATQIKYYDCSEGGRVQSNIQDCPDGYRCALNYEPDGDIYAGYCTSGFTLPNIFDYYTTVRLERDSGAFMDEITFRPNDVPAVIADRYTVEVSWVTATHAEIIFDGQSYVLRAGENATVGDNEDMVLIFANVTKI